MQWNRLVPTENNSQHDLLPCTRGGSRGGVSMGSEDFGPCLLIYVTVVSSRSVELVLAVAKP